MRCETGASRGGEPPVSPVAAGPAAPGDGPSRGPLPAEAAAVGRSGERPRLVGAAIARRRPPHGRNRHDRRTARHRQRREGQGPRHPRRHPHPEDRSSGSSGPATAEERQTLARFGGFGPVALSIFPDPVTGRYKDAGWQALGEELKSLLTPEEYDSAKRTTFNAFYTSPIVIAAMHGRLPASACPTTPPSWSPAAAPATSWRQAPAGHALHRRRARLASPAASPAPCIPTHDIRIENFRDTKLPEGRIDAVIGNVPFADVKLDYRGQKLSAARLLLRQVARRPEARRRPGPGHQHFTLDKQNAADPRVPRRPRPISSGRSACRPTPSSAKARRSSPTSCSCASVRPGEPAQPRRPRLAGRRAAGHRRRRRPDQPLLPATIPRWCWAPGAARTALRRRAATASSATATWPRSSTSAIRRLPEFAPIAGVDRAEAEPAPAFAPPPPERHITEGSFFVGDDRIICQVEGGQGRARHLWRHAAQGRRHDDRQAARRPGRPPRPRPPRPAIAERRLARGQPRRGPPGAEPGLRPASSPAYGPINKTTFGETADGTVIRRMPNLVKFREDPDAMLVMSLEDYDEVTGKAAKAAIMTQGRGRQDARPSPRSQSAEEGLLVSLDRSGDGRPAATSPRSTASPRTQVIAELGDLIYHDPESKTWQTADDYLSGNVRAKLAAAEAAGPAYRPQRRGPAGRAARGRAARRHRRQSRCPVDTGERHPGVRRRPVRRRRRPPSRSAI